VLQFVVLTAAVLLVVPLSFDFIGGLDKFVEKALENFFAITSGEYTWDFLIAFGFYNLFFIAGNWAYVQRYTSVPDQMSAKKVGWLFGLLYIISPVIWMVPPMVYRIVNPDLAGLADEGAYLLMCKKVLPVGMLGLMLGGIIFAASSSVNTTLNISAGVISNDVYKHFRPNASNVRLVGVGRISTVLLGFITILIALMVPAMGGIVEAVISLGAITGGALFLPPIWTLFSKVQTGRTVLMATIITLTINVFFKFFTPILFDYSLSRASEMVLGVVLPILILAYFELRMIFRPRSNPLYEEYLKTVSARRQQTAEDIEVSDRENLRGSMILGIGIFSTGVLMLILSIISDNGEKFLLGIALLVTIIGGWIASKGIIKKLKV
jgi:Na+/proline symporter